jgi:hypothetical protein
MSLSSEQIKQQSLAAYNQWAEQWRRHAKHHSKYDMKPLSDFQNSGIGRAILCVANGYSFELEIETIKKHRENVDILACDKTLGHLLRHGIKPDFVIVCDANVNYEKYLEPWKDQLQDTVLFASVAANPEWADKGNWKDRYFFTLVDVLGSEKEFQALSGCRNAIPAGTNVSNSMVVFLTQSDNDGRRNFFGYDKILLIGFDYCWREGGSYYAFDKDGGGKANYMRHVYTRNIANDLCYVSNNLGFSAQWLQQYVETFKLPVVQCSRESVLSLKNIAALSDQMKYSYKREDREKVSALVRLRRELMAKAKEAEESLNSIGRDHHYAHMGTV